MNAATQKLAETVFPEATAVAALTKHVAKNGVGGGGTNNGGGGGKNGGGDGQPKVEREKHICSKCKMMV